MAFIDPTHPELIVEQYETERLIERLGHHFVREDALTRAQYEAMITDLRTSQFEPAPWQATS